MQIVAASGTHQLAQTISQQLSLPLQILTSDRFPNRELKIRLSAVAPTTILIGSFSTPVNTRIIEYLLAADALKRQGCRSLIGIITYLAYSKQDKVFLPGEPLSAKVIASIIQTGPFSRLYTIDLHNPSITGYFDIPVTNLSAVNLLAETAKPYLNQDTIVVSPDAGSVKNSLRFADKLGLTTIFATKTRNLETGEVSFYNLSHPVNGRHTYIYDDMIATGNTLFKLAKFLKQNGAASINIYCTHHLYLKDVQQHLDNSPIDHLTVTNTVAKPENLNSPKLTIIDVAPIIVDQLAKDLHHD